ncbi:MAG: Holo-(acyl-carrier-protein) synthase [Deltaproteobacteria bacterium]|nr:Holo-(acyl-carrier-protein) synthase [Deltaproteobacteria bacterium]
MVGIDIVDVLRMEGIMKRFGERFLNRVFTDKELDYVRKRLKPQESLAGRFAAKEAFIKAYGQSAGFKEIEVLQQGGRPYINFRGKVYQAVSISHERAYAVAVVIIGKERDSI